MRFIFFLLTLSPLCAYVNQNGDFQIWTREYIRGHITPHWDISVMQENRIGDHASKPYHIFLQAQGIYRPAPWIGLAPGYRQSWRRFPLDSSRWRPEYSPMFDVMLRWHLGEWEFSDRNRVQYIIFQSDPAHWLYRNRFRIVTPWHFTRFCFTPFIDNEWFFQERYGFDQDRLSAGLMTWIYKNLSGQIYYMRRFEKTGADLHWIHQNILNITLLLAY